MVGRRRKSGEPPDGAAGTGAGCPATEHESFQDCVRAFVQLMPRISRGLRRAPTPCGSPDVKLGHRHGVALSMLRERGPRTVGTLAAELGLTLATVSGIVAELEHAGFVSRSADPADRRRTVVRLIDRRDDAVDLWLDSSTAPVARALEKLTTKERTALLKAMTRLDAELEQAHSSSERDPGPANDRQ